MTNQRLQQDFSGCGWTGAADQAPSGLRPCLIERPVCVRRRGNIPARAKPRRRSWRTVAWVLVCTTLILGLGAQLAWAKRDALIADSTVGPLLASVCDTLGCRLPLVSAPSQLRLLARDVEQHPSVQDGLLITASVRNDAAFAQPYPVVTIVLSDANGQRLAMRRFQPEDYVGDAAVRARGLAGGATTAMVFEVQDPGQRAVAFAFSFD